MQSSWRRLLVVNAALLGAAGCCSARSGPPVAAPREEPAATGAPTEAEADVAPAEPADVAPAGPADAGRLPGPCVDPALDAMQRFVAECGEGGCGDAELAEEVAAEPLYPPEGGEPLDLDGDGTADVALTHPWFGGSGGYTYQLYVRRGGCGHWVGALSTTGFEVLGRRASGLVELALFTQAGSCDVWESHARFDGERYEVYEERECRCRVASPMGDDECGPWAPP